MITTSEILLCRGGDEETLTCYLAATGCEVSAALKDTNLATNYRVRDAKEKWFDIRLERDIMARRRSKTAEEEVSEHLTITQECINDSSGVTEQLTSQLFSAANSN